MHEHKIAARAVVAVWFSCDASGREPARIVSTRDTDTARTYPHLQPLSVHQAKGDHRARYAAKTYLVLGFLGASS